MGTTDKGAGFLLAKMLDEIFARQSGGGFAADAAEARLRFCADPDHYAWCCAGRQEMHVPFRRYPAPAGEAERVTLRTLFDGNVMRWELHPVWVVEGRLRRGESNVLHRRRFYIGQGDWRILFGEGFDPADRLIKCYLLAAGAETPAGVWGRWYWV